MPSWKKVIISGSNAALNNLTVTSGVTGSLLGTASYATSASQAITASFALTASYSKNLQVSGSINNVDYIDFTTSNIIGTNAPAWKEGRLFYDSGSGALAFYNWEQDVTLNIGQEQWMRARNQTGVTITNGSVVRISGAVGDRPTIVLAQSTDQTNTFSVDNEIIGMATHDIENGTDGFVTTFGLVNGVNTSAFTAGDVLWVSQSAGQVTKVPPAPPFDKTFVGIVTRVNPSNGSIFMTPLAPIHFHDISSVSASVYQQGDLWMYRSGSAGQANAWINTKQLSGSYGLTGSLNINGTALITGSAAIGTSSLGPSENTITLGARDTTAEGGQIGFNAPGGTYTSASFIDNWQNKARLLKGTNASSTGVIAQWDIHTTQMSLPGYTAVSSFPGTAAANLAVDSGGNVITVSTTGGTVFPYVGNAVITGSLTVTQPIYVPINGNMYFQGGDDAALYDVNIVNTMGIYGVQDVTVGAVKLGSNGPVLYGSSSRLGIGTITPNSGALHVSGGVFATSFTGSLLGTSSWATNASTASFVTASNVFGPLGSNSVISASQAITASYVANISPAITNNTNNYILTATGGSTINGEANLTFDGATLNIATRLQQGSNVTAAASNAHAQGANTLASGRGSHAEGHFTTSSGDYSHAEGYLSKAIGDYSHAEGYNSEALEQSSHAEGDSAQANSYASHAEGYNTITNGSYSHAEGGGTNANGLASHAEGYGNGAYGDYSHAEGTGTSATGWSAHSEGLSTTASGSHSHAEGRDTISYGNWSHAEGRANYTYGTYSHAEGSGNYTYGEYSHAEGLGTVTSASYQHAQGQYNLGLLGDSAFIIGNGVDDTTRSNLVFALGSEFQVTGSVLIENTDIASSVFATANIDNFAEIAIQNLNSGTNASSDIVATADNGDDSVFFIDMGINSTNFNDPALLGAAGDAYMFSTGNNLYIGNATSDKEIIIFNGGLNAQDNARMWVHNQGTVVIGGTGSYNGGNPPALQINPLPGTTTYNIIQAKGDIDAYAQIGAININSGSSASTDIVAYNSSAGEAQVTGFIDMGINSPNYTDINFPGWTGSDSYVYSDSPRMLVGTTNTTSSYINFFVGGLNVNTNSKLKLYSSSFHQLTGSLTATSGFTGSLQGTASFATTSSYVTGSIFTSTNLALSSSFAVTASYATIAQNVLGTITNASTASFVTASNVFGPFGSSSIVSASFAVSSSRAVSSSFAITASYATIAQNVLGTITNASTASFVTASNVFGPNGSNSILSSSYALTASFALNGGGSAITVKEEGSNITTALASLDFVGAGVVASAVGNAVTVTIAGGGGAAFPYTGDAVITGSLAISQSLLQYSSTTAVTVGAPVNIASFPTSSYRAGFFDYVAFSSTNARAGTVMAVWNGANVEFNETSTNDIGTTSALTLSASLSGANIRLQGVSTSGTWTVETLARLI